MRTRTPRILLASLLGAAIVVTTPPAGAAASDPPVTITSTTTITGQGFGHGKGLSQYGARGRAEDNQTYRQILGFYYPSTAVGSFAGKVRVLITADTDDNTTVRATPGLRLTDTGRAKTWVLPTSKNPRAWRLRVRDGHTQVLYRTGTWHRYSPGGHSVLAGDGQFSSSSGLVTLRLPSGDRVYRGALRLSNKDTVNVVGMERYLKGVVAAEMPALWHPQALRAQAVAARTYAAFQRADNASRYYQICDTSACQVYKGFAAEQPQTNDAIDATKGEIRTYGGAPAFTQFSASNGGYSVAGSQPYLQALPDPFDTYSWTKPLDAAAVARIETAYPTLGTLTGVQILVRDGKGAYGGRVTSIRLVGKNQAVTTSKDLTGDQFRSLLGLKSTLFTVG
jgi:stage II sporulation protein D